MDSITAFDKKKIGSNTDDGIYGKGFYFSTHKKQAEQYAENGGRVHKTYLKLNNPLRLNGLTIDEVAELLDVSESILTDIGGIVKPRYSFTEQFTSHLLSAGYDSVIVDYGNSDEIIVFKSNPPTP